MSSSNALFSTEKRATPPCLALLPSAPYALGGDLPWGWRHGHEERRPGLLAQGAVVDLLPGAAASTRVSISPCKRGPGVWASTPASLPSLPPWQSLHRVIAGILTKMLRPLELWR
jgi:hypothetical protein